MADAARRLGELSVSVLPGGLIVGIAGGRGPTVVVEAPPGAGDRVGALDPDAVVRGVLLTGGRWESVGGLLGLLHALADRGQGALDVVHGLREERAGLLVDAWSRGWPGRLPIASDAIGGGETVGWGPLRVRTLALVAPDGEGVIAYRLETGSAGVAWVPSCRPGTRLAAFLRDVDLAVLVVGEAGGLDEPSAQAAARGAREVLCQTVGGAEAHPGPLH